MNERLCDLSFSFVLYDLLYLLSTTILPTPSKNIVQSIYPNHGRRIPLRERGKERHYRVGKYESTHHHFVSTADLKVLIPFVEEPFFIYHQGIIDATDHSNSALKEASYPTIIWTLHLYIQNNNIKTSFDFLTNNIRVLWPRLHHMRLPIGHTIPILILNHE